MDREKVIRIIDELISEAQKEPTWKTENALRCLKKELLKEQEATGHWVSINDGDTVAIDNDGFPERACYCSKCQKYLIASDEYAVYGRYCPFCGAKMEGR